LLGFVEGEGYFCTKDKVGLEFGLTQTKSELLVIEAIKNFLLKLPGSYIKKRKNSNVVRIFTDKNPKNIRSNLVTKLAVNDLNYIKSVIIPFFDNLV
jgi:polyphosphate kinase